MNYSEDMQVAVIAAYRKGLSVEGVANELGISSDSQVWHILRKTGTPMRPQNYRRRVSYNGVSYRSSYEVAYAKYLDLNSIKYKYEPRKFRIQGNSTYTPDFYLVDSNTYVEIKGFDGGNNQRIRRRIVAHMYDIRILILTKYDLQSLGIIT
jgi:hypothetical protein